MRSREKQSTCQSIVVFKRHYYDSARRFCAYNIRLHDIRYAEKKFLSLKNGAARNVEL